MGKGSLIFAEGGDSVAANPPLDETLVRRALTLLGLPADQYKPGSQYTADSLAALCVSSNTVVMDPQQAGFTEKATTIRNSACAPFKNGVTTAYDDYVSQLPQVERDKIQALSATTHDEERLAKRPEIRDAVRNHPAVQKILVGVGTTGSTRPETD